MKIKTRLYCPNVDLESGNQFSLDQKQAHYLRNVMRCTSGEYVGVFNGVDGEFACEIVTCDKKALILQVISKIREHLPPDPICLIFAVIKKTPMDYLVQKATELGVGILQPIITDRTVIRDVNIQRLETIAIEAAEQCGLTAIPEIKTLQPLKNILDDYKHILFCDETGQGLGIAQVIQQNPIDAILIGPEGGFSPSETDYLYKQENCYATSLGKRIMRAETAATASLSIVQHIFSCH